MVGAVVQEKADLFLRPPRSTTTMAPPITPVINSTFGTTYSIITANTTAVPIISTTRHHPTAADLTDDELRVRVGLAMSVTFMAGLIQVRVLCRYSKFRLMIIINLKNIRSHILVGR